MKGILFKPDMIQAIFEGRKTQTRRIIKPQPKDGYKWDDKLQALIQPFAFGRINVGLVLPIKPRYQVGEVVYIKEAYSTYGYPEVPYYKDEPGLDVKAIAWHSPMMMPEKYARYFIKILAVTPQRLQEITEEDALAEGVREYEPDDFPVGGATYGLYIERFARLWDSINPQYPWESNCWVWKIEFKLSNTTKGGENAH